MRGAGRAEAERREARLTELRIAYDRFCAAEVERQIATTYSPEEPVKRESSRQARVRVRRVRGARSLHDAPSGQPGPVTLHPGSQEVLCVAKVGHDDIQPTGGARIDAMEVAARVLVQIPDRRRHLVRYYGAYSNATCRKRDKGRRFRRAPSPDEAPQHAAIPDGPYRAALRRRVGPADPPCLRSRPSRVSPLRERNARDPSPASALCAASGHPRVRSAPRAAVRSRGKADVSAPHPSPSLLAALGAHIVQGSAADPHHQH